MTTITRHEMLSGSKDDRLKDMRDSLRAMGVNVSNDRTDILDTFLTKRRYFDTNIFSTFAQGDDIKDLDTANKAKFSRALDTVEKMPSMFSKGGNPTWSAIKDYAAAGVTDPTNLLSILAGAFTLGSGGAAVWGAKEAAKQGVKASLKAKVRALGNKAVLKSLAVEGAVAGTGGFGQALRRQNVDMDLGRRKKDDYNLLEAGTQGVLEGVLSPLAGAGMNIAGTGVLGGIKQASKATGISDSTAIAGTKNFIEKWFLPYGGLDEASVRSLEISQKEFAPLKAKLEQNSIMFEKIFKRDFNIKNQDDIDLVNAAMSRDKIASQKLETRSPDMKKAIDEWRGLVEESQKLSTETLQASDYLKEIYQRDPNYVRTWYEKFGKHGRIPFQKWIQQPEHTDFVNRFITQIGKNEELGIRLGVIDPKTKKYITDDPAKLKDVVAKALEKEYIVDPTKRQKYGALKQRDPDLDKLLKELWGENSNPAIRATETIMGIVEPVTDIKMAGSLADSLLNRGLAFRAIGGNDAVRANMASIAAKEKGITEPLVKLVTGRDVRGTVLDPDSPFIIRSDLYADELKEVYIPKSLANKLKVMTENQQFITDNVLVNSMAGVQGYLKKFKTVYNPFAHPRNILGAGQYVINSGNLRGFGEYLKYLKTASPEEKSAFMDKINKLGLRGSAVELNQILNRISDSADDPNLLRRVITGFGTLGVSEFERTQLGKKVSRFATGVYSGTDDLGKVMTFMSERVKAKKVWDAMDDIGKEASRAKYIKEFGAPLDKQGKALTGKQLDNQVLDEMATQKALNVVPVYSRIPKILEAMRGIPILGSFTAFPAENLRNKYKILKLGAEEIRDGFETGNRELVKTGANRLTAQGAMAGAATVAAYTYNSVMGTDKAMDMIREASPEWQKYHALQVRPGEDGKLYVTDLSYLNPDQYVLDMIMPLMVTAANGEDITNTLDNGMSSIIENMYKPFLDPSLLTQFSTQMFKAITSDESTAADALAKAYKLQEPGIIKLGRELAGDFNVLKDLGTFGKEFQIRTDPLYYGEDRANFNDTKDLATKLAKYGIPTGSQLAMAPFSLSIKEREFDPKKQMGFTLKTLVGDSNRKWNKTTSDIRKRLQDTDLQFNLKGLLEKYNEALEEQYVSQQGVNQLINSYEKYYGPQAVRKLLHTKVIKEAGGLSNTEINQLIKNRFTPSRLPTTFWSKLINTNPELGKYIPKYRNEFNKIYRQYLNRELSKDLPEINISKGNN
jgi:hypothetical protein